MRAVAIAGILLQLTLQLRPDSMMFTRPLTEDSFYSISVARSLSEGKGISVDGVHPTNGVQPLICFFYAPLFMFSGGEDALALRFILLLQNLIFAGAAAAIAWYSTTLVRDRENRREVFWLVMMLVAWSGSLVVYLVNGLETGLAVAMTFLSAAYYNARIEAVHEPPLRRFFTLGVLLGVAVLTRIDIALFVPVVIAWHIYRSHLNHRQKTGKERRVALQRTVVESLAIGGMSVLVSLPWWIYNLVWFGSVMPISGQAQQFLNTDRGLAITITLRFLADSFIITTHSPTPLSELFAPAGTLLFLFMLGMILLLTRSLAAATDAFSRWRSFWQIPLAVPLATFAVGLVIYYTFFFGAPHFINRYLVTWRILSSLLLVSLLYLAWTSEHARPSLRVILGMVLAGLMLLSSYGFSWNFSDKKGNLHLIPARWIIEHTTPEESVGMFQSGTTGFLCPNVVNLDGKVNPNALEALKRQGISRYIDSMQFNYIIDWDYFIGLAMSDSLTQSHYQVIDTLPTGWKVLKRVDGSR